MINDAQLHLQLLDPKTMSLERLLWEISQLPSTGLRAGASSEDRQHEFRLLRQITPGNGIRLSCFAGQGKFGLWIVCPEGKLELSGMVANRQVEQVRLTLGQVQIADLPKTVAELFEMARVKPK